MFYCVHICEELTHWKRLWCWEGLGAGGEGEDRGWDGWMASPTRWTWVWVNSGSWWWTGRPGVLQFMGSQRVGHDWVTELNWTEYWNAFTFSPVDGYLGFRFFQFVLLLLLYFSMFLLKHCAKQCLLDIYLEAELLGQMIYMYCTPLQYSCLENPMDGGAWWAAPHGVSKSRTRLSNFTFTSYFHALEKEMATHSSVLAWRIPGTEEPGGLPSMGSHRVGHDWSNLAAAAAASDYLQATLPGSTPTFPPSVCVSTTPHSCHHLMLLDCLFSTNWQV